jgi:type IV secretion system protein VirD4
MTPRRTPRQSGSTLEVIASEARRRLGGRVQRASGASWLSEDSNLASSAALRALRVKGAEPGRLVIGRHVAAGFHLGRSQLLATEGRHSVLVVGPTQTLKTAGLAVPSILEWQGPVVAASVKDDLLATTLPWRSGLGETWVFDPSRSTRHGSDGWSPLEMCGDWTGARRTAASLVSQAKISGVTDADFWYATAAKLLAPLLFAAALSGHTMADVVRWVDTRERELVESILQRSSNAQAMSAAWASFDREERLLSSVYTTAETVLEPFGDREVGRVQAEDGISVKRLLDGGCHTLYICSPSHEQARLRPLFSALVEQVLDVAYARASSTSGSLDPPLLVVLDEAANIAPIASLDALASTAASHGIQLVTVWQDLAQVHARYGERASTVVNNHRAKLFLSGISDIGTLDYVHRIAGERRLRELSVTRDPRGGRSTTWHAGREPLLGTAQVRRIPPGTGILVYGHLPPAAVAMRPWFRDSTLSARVP